MFRNRKLLLLNKKSTCSYQRNNLSITKRQSGSALMMAIFVIIVISLLGASLVNMLDSSHENVAFEVIGTRAYTAAQTGIQWQLSQIFPLDLVAPLDLGGQACQTQATIDLNIPPLPNIDGLAGCQIADITCTNFDHAGTTYYTITSTGQCNIDNEVTSRTIMVEARSMR